MKDNGLKGGVVYDSKLLSYLFLKKKINAWIFLFLFGKALDFGERAKREQRYRGND
jgi:hypothetical protein